LTSITIETIQARLDPTAAILWDVSLPLSIREPVPQVATPMRRTMSDHRALVSVDAVSKTYGAGDTAVHALRDVSLDVRAGEIFGVIGRSGAGKSTLIRLLNGLEQPDSGRVQVARTDLASLKAGELRRQRRDIGMIFQHFNLLNARNVFGNVALPLELAGLPKAEIKARVAELLDLVGLTEKSATYPAALSGGQKQRVAIARALATRPSILLSDEATSALDPETTQSILALLKRINAELGVTIILITHQMAVIRQICHRVAVLERGRIVESGDTYDFFTAPASEAGRILSGRASLPDHVRHRLSAGNAVLRLILAGDSARSPVLSQVTRASGIDFTILEGEVDLIADRPLGVFLVEVPETALSEGFLASLESHGIRAEVLAHVG
jgi:D-methionine transport system ATP-binding protein